MHVGILGAGAVGCTVGARLARSGARVSLVGRAGLGAEIADHGLTVSRSDEPPFTVPAADVGFFTSCEALSACDVVLVTVKSRDTARAAELARPVLSRGTVVVSLQNGVRNRRVLVDGLPGHPIVSGMVPFNVLRRDGARFHQGTSGPLVLEPHAPPGLVAGLRQGGAPTVIHRDLAGVLWGKLLLNLNNAVNALTGVTLVQQLADRRIRALMAALIDEAKSVLRTAGIRPRGVGRIQPTIAPTVLRLPDWLFPRVAGAMVKIDPKARSSMWEDLQRRRPTEIDDLNGQVVRVARRTGASALRNQAIVELVREAEESGHGCPGLGIDDLWARVMVP